MAAYVPHGSIIAFDQKSRMSRQGRTQRDWRLETRARSLSRSERCVRRFRRRICVIL
jgi:hypothetical protein